VSEGITVDSTEHKGGDQSGEVSSSTATATATGRVRLGRYTLDFDHPGGTTLALTPDAPEASAPQPLRQQLAGPEPPARRTPSRVERANDLIDQASEVTDRVENVLGILESIAQGRLPGAGLLAQEGDDVLAALGRLDRAGHFAEVVKLGRPACRLFALTLRWAALVESLRLVLHAGTALADTPSMAWAEHELGSLQLAAGNPERARALLESARDRRARIEDREGLAATEHNLALLDVAQGASHSLRRLVSVGGILALALMLGFATAVGGGTSSAHHTISTRSRPTRTHTTSTKKKTTTTGAPTLSVTPAPLIFSQAEGTTSAPMTVTVTAHGGSVTVGQARIMGANAPEFAAPDDTCSGHTIAAGGACTLAITFAAPPAVFRPASLVIPQSRTRAATLILANSTSEATAQIALSGTIAAAPAAPVAIASPSSATIVSGAGAVPNASQTFTLSNSGTAPLIVGQVTIAGADPSAFAITAGSDGCSNTTVAPNQSCTVTVTASPGFSAANASGELTFPDNAAGSPQPAALQVAAQQPQ
jgi:hypothetical protein